MADLALGVLGGLIGASWARALWIIWQHDKADPGR
jgi:hypothetical protein